MLAPLTIPADPAERFARLVAALCRAVAAGHGRGIPGPLVLLVWSRLRRMAVRFARLAARVRAGALPARAAPRRPGRSGPPPPPLPRKSGWLISLVPQAAASASQLQHLLADPEMAALVAAAPQMGRILRPLCRMLGVVPPPGLCSERRPAPARPRPAAPRPEAPRPAPPAAEPEPRPPKPAWLRRSGLPGRRRPLPFPTPG